MKKLKMIKLLVVVIGLMLMEISMVRAEEMGPHLDLKVRESGNKVYVDVDLKPEGVKISGVETTIKFPEESLKFDNYETTKLLPVEIMSPQAENGRVKFSLAISPQQQEVEQDGKLVELEFTKTGQGIGELKTENTIITSLESETNLSTQESKVRWEKNSVWSRLMNLLKKILAIFQSKEVSK